MVIVELKKPRADNTEPELLQRYVNHLNRQRKGDFFVCITSCWHYQYTLTMPTRSASK